MLYLSRLLLVLLALLLGACQSLPEQSVTDQPATPNASSSEDELQFITVAKPKPLPPPPVRENLWRLLANDFTFHKNPANNNARVEHYRKQYLRHRLALNALFDRAAPYLYYIHQAVEARNLPPEIVLLPAVESSFIPTANSEDHAGGLWQIIPNTARGMRLPNDPWVDGRRDVQTSTRAALAHLQRLHQRLDNNWLLALAAYNAGEYRVKRALKRSPKAAKVPKGSEYWHMTLPRETRNYVPRLIALCSILADPERYGIHMPYLANKPWFTEVPVSRAIALEQAADMSGIPLDLMKRLNPGLVRAATPPKRRTNLLVPIVSENTFRRVLPKVPEHVAKTLFTYRVVSGDTLGGIAQRFDVSVHAIREANGLRGSFIRAGKTLQIPEELPQTTVAVNGARTIHHRVKRGDSLWSIAKQYRVSTKDLVRWNRLNPRRYLRLGQAVKIYVRSGRS